MKSSDKRKQRQEKVSMADAFLANQEQDRGGVKLPKGVPSFKPEKPGTFKISIVPYRATKAHPYVRNGTIEAGSPVPERTYYIHYGIGPEKKVVLCSARTTGKPCFICEYRDNLLAQPDRDETTEKLAKDLKPKQRQLWNVYDHKAPEKGVQVWEEAYHNFGVGIVDKITNADDEDKRKYKRFTLTNEKGMLLKVTGTQGTYGSGKYIECTDIEFHPRGKALPEEVVKAAVVLDNLVPEAMEYNAVKKLFKGGAAEDDFDEDDSDDDRDEDDDDTDAEDEEEGTEDDADDDDDTADEGDDEEDSDDDDDVTGPAVGDLVKCSYKGTKYRGKLVKINKKDSLGHVRVKGREKPLVMDLDELSVVTDTSKKPAEPDDDEDDTPAPRRAGKKPRKKPKGDDDFDDDDEVPF